MKYVALCALSILTMLSASASPSVAPLAAAASAQMFVPSFTPVNAPGVPDSFLMTMVGGALVALQLRRRQKSMRSPRVGILSS